MFGYQIAKSISENKKTDEYILHRYQKRKEKFDKAVLDKSDGYSNMDQSFYEWDGKLLRKPNPFEKPLYIIMDKGCKTPIIYRIQATHKQTSPPKTVR